MKLIMGTTCNNEGIEPIPGLAVADINGSVMKNLDYVPFMIGQQFVCPIVNDDRTGTTELEDTQLDSFCASLPLGGWWQFGAREEFARDEVTGMMGECRHARYMLLPDDWEKEE